MCVSLFATGSNTEEEALLSLTPGLTGLFQSDTEDEEFRGFSDLK